MEALSEIKKRIKNIAGKSEQNMFTAKVESVDGDTCSVSVDGLVLTDVRLRAVINNESSKLIVTPVVGSYVLVADLSGGNYAELAVLNVSEIDSITLDVDNDIVINGGENDGLVKINELTEKLNNLVTWCENHVHSGVITAVSGGSGAPAVGTPGNSAVPTSQPQSFSKTDYEDNKIKH